VETGLRAVGGGGVGGGEVVCNCAEVSFERKREAGSQLRRKAAAAVLRRLALGAKPGKRTRGPRCHVSVTLRCTLSGFCLPPSS